MRVLEVSLRKAGFTVTTAISVLDAFDKLELGAPDLIISETTFPDGDGFDLRKRVRARAEWDEIPFIFLTAEAAIENKIRGLELGVDDYLTKPIYIKEIVTRINILLQKRQRVRFEERRDGRTRFAGRVADMPVVDVIQTIEISRKSGVIQFVGERNRQAAIYFRDGRVIDAEAGALQGEDAVYRLLTWSEGDFEVVFRTVRRREVIATSSQGLLMEGMRRLDEWSRLLEQLPPLSHRFEVDAGELAARLGDVPDDNNPILRLIDGKRTLLEVIDASAVGDLECLQAISRLYFEEMLSDIDHGAPMRHPTGGRLVELDQEYGRSTTPIEGAARDSAEHDIAGPEPEPLPESPAAEPLDEQQVVEEINEPPQTSEGELMGTLRPSSLHLIDEAVAAAQAIEPDLFKDDVAAFKPRAPSSELDKDATPRLDTDHVVHIGGADPMIFDVAEAEPIEDSRVSFVMDRSVPEPIERDAPSQRMTAADARRLGRDESALRMIGSLGRDRAETSGEVSLGQFAFPRSSTEREMITIMPRRITREIQVTQAETVEVDKEIEDVEVETPKPAPVEAPPRLSQLSIPPPRLDLSGSGVRRQSGPGKGAMALLALAGLLAIVAIYLYATRPAKQTKKAVDDAGAIPEPDAIVEDTGASVTPPVVTDAAVARDGSVDAPVVQDAAVARDAVVDKPPSDATPLEDPIAKAKALYDQAFTALEDSDYARALQLVDQSLKLRKTARSYVLRSQALQRMGRVDDALAALSAAESTFPSAAIYEARARIYKAAGRRDEARTAVEKYLSMVPDKGPTVKLFKQWLEELR